MADRRGAVTAVVLAAALLSGWWAVRAAEPPVERLRAEVVRTLPHDRDAFTQGLVVADGALYESLGRYGESRVRRIDLATGDVRTEAWLASTLFGEGLTRVGGRLIQLTWREGRALLWTLPELRAAGERAYQGEGWGLAFDGRRLVMSDGSDRLTFRDPDTFAPLGSVTVTLEGRPVTALNALEWANGAVWANVWGREEVLRIDPAGGRVTAVADASHLLSEEDRAGVDVLNGIAYDPSSGHFWLTGKLWPLLYEVRLVPASSP